MENIVDFKIPRRFLLIEGELSFVFSTIFVVLLKNFTIMSKIMFFKIFFADCEDVIGGDLFSSLVINVAQTQSLDICLLCFESPVNVKNLSKNNITYNIFKDPLGWKGEPSVSDKLSDIFSKDLSNFIVFIDSLSQLFSLYGPCNSFKFLTKIKCLSQGLVGMVHKELLSNYHLEKLQLMCTTYISLQKNFNNLDLELNNYSCKKNVKLVQRKQGGKISSQRGIISINQNCVMFNEDKKHKNSSTVSVNPTNDDFKDLTTFELGIEMKDSEKKAKDQLILPYLRYFAII